MRAREPVLRTPDEAVFLKPAGLSSEAPAHGGPGPETLLVQARTTLGWPDAQLPHRLDRPTRGFVVVARDRTAVAALNAGLREGRWTKRYLARIAPRAGGAQAVSRPDALVGPHRAYLQRKGAISRVVRAGGDPARLSVDAVMPAPGRRDEWHALVTLGTGRFHQVRAMLAHLGFPLVGDERYGGAPGSMYLDHAWLEFVTVAGDVRHVGVRDDPGREPVAPELLDLLYGS